MTAWDSFHPELVGFWTLSLLSAPHCHEPGCLLSAHWMPFWWAVSDQLSAGLSACKMHSMSTRWQSAQLQAVSAARTPVLPVQTADLGPTPGPAAAHETKEVKSDDRQHAVSNGCTVHRGHTQTQWTAKALRSCWPLEGCAGRDCGGGARWGTMRQSCAAAWKCWASRRQRWQPRRRRAGPAARACADAAAPECPPSGCTAPPPACAHAAHLRVTCCTATCTMFELCRTICGVECRPVGHDVLDVLQLHQPACDCSLGFARSKATLALSLTDRLLLQTIMMASPKAYTWHARVGVGGAPQAKQRSQPERGTAHHTRVVLSNRKQAA